MFKKTNELPGDMFLRESFDGPLMKIKRLEPTVAKRALGCYISPASKQETQMEVIREKSLNGHTKSNHHIYLLRTNKSVPCIHRKIDRVSTFYNINELPTMPTIKPISPPYVAQHT